jgi:NAD(P)H-flavin reductase
MGNTNRPINEILSKRLLAPFIVRFEVYTPIIAEKVKAGQFVVLRMDDYAERVPLTVADHNLESGTIILIFQVVGVSTRKLEKLNAGDVILDIVGPLGEPSHINTFGTVVCIGGGGQGT